MLVENRHFSTHKDTVGAAIYTYRKTIIMGLQGVVELFPQNAIAWRTDVRTSGRICYNRDPHAERVN